MDSLNSVDSLFRAEFPRLVRSLGVAFGAEQAADAVQEAFIAADRRWDRIARYSDPAGWVRRVALNRLLNERRTQWRRSAIVDALRLPEHVERTTELVDLEASVNALPAQQRTAVCLHYLGGYRIDEVAEMMEIAPGTVKAHLHAARSTLRVTLAEVES